jgi:sulfatase modifying factor 1
MMRRVALVALALIGAAVLWLTTAGPSGPPPRPAPPPVFPLGDAFETLGPEAGASGLPRRVRHRDSGIVLILIPAGEFTMGSTESEPRRETDEPRLEVRRVETPFYLGETEVTVGEWRRITGEEPSDPDTDETLPIGVITWHRAMEAIATLNEEGEGGWRLPTEVEWEYACRAGTTTVFSFGDNITTDQVNYDGRSPYNGSPKGLRRDGPVPVRSLPPNPWGLYEMHGNAFEWCAELYVPRPGRDRPPTDPGASRSIRGGAWNSRARETRSAYRDGYPPGSSGAKYGVRLAKSLPTAGGR